MKKIKQTFKFKPFSKKQRMVLNWWCDTSPVKDMDGIIADGAIRSGKTVCMSLSFVMWAMTQFNGQNFGMCGKTIGSFRRNVLFWLEVMLRSRGYTVADHRADNLVVVTRGETTNYFYIFGGKDERSQDLIQGITLAGVFFDEVALMPESFVNQATGRCSVEGSKYWFNCNPDGPYHWFKTGWIDKATGYLGKKKTQEIAVYNGVLILHNAYEAASNGLKMIAAIRAVAHGTATAAETAATTGASAAQIAFNAALYACPLTWIVLAIIAVIAAIYLIVAAINKVQGTTYSATGVICGAVATAGAFILNTGIGLLNGLIQSAWSMFVEPFLSIVEWVLNVVNGGFDSFGGAVANLIGNIISWFLSLGKVVTQIIDAIFGTDWTAGLESLQNEVLSWGKTENAITLDRSAPTIDYRMSYTDAYSKGYEWGQGIENTIKDFFGGAGAEDDNSGSYGGESDMTNYLSGIAGDTASISDSLDVSEEDLKYLRDIAEQEAINRFTTAEIKVDMSGMSNTVHNTNDLDGIVDGLTTRVLQAMEVVRDGA